MADCLPGEMDEWEGERMTSECDVNLSGLPTMCAFEFWHASS